MQHPEFHDAPWPNGWISCCAMTHADLEFQACMHACMLIMLISKFEFRRHMRTKTEPGIYKFGIVCTIPRAELECLREYPLRGAEPARHREDRQARLDLLERAHREDCDGAGLLRGQARDHTRDAGYQGPRGGRYGRHGIAHAASGSIGCTGRFFTFPVFFS